MRFVEPSNEMVPFDSSAWFSDPTNHMLLLVPDYNFVDKYKVTHFWYFKNYFYYQNTGKHSIIIILWHNIHECATHNRLNFNIKLNRSMYVFPIK